MLRSYGALHGWKGHIVQSDSCTYHSGKVSTTIDYYVVSNLLRYQHCGSSGYSEAGTAPHALVGLSVSTGYCRQPIHTCKKPKRSPLTRPLTVPRQPLDYQPFSDECANATSQPHLDALLPTLGRLIMEELLAVHDITDPHAAAAYSGRFDDLSFITLLKSPSYKHTIYRETQDTFGVKALFCLVKACLACLEVLLLLRFSFDSDFSNGSAV